MDRAKKRILIVEDERDLRTLLSWALSQDGFDVSLAENGEEGLRQAISSAPDLVLLDLMMPKLDGYSVCRQLRSCENTSKIPVLILSAFGSPYSAAQCHSCGATDFITKPFSIRDLKARIEEVLDAGD
jgi:DNA-binding response OmpR family regulator